MRTCPGCGKEYDEAPALSRRDNRTFICPLCGMMEAFAAWRISSETADKVVDVKSSSEPDD